MPGITPFFFTAALAVVMILARPALAQEGDRGECGPDELDMGDFCVSVIPAESGDDMGRKATPFRKKSMMPGVVTTRSPKQNSGPELNSAGDVQGAMIADTALGVQIGVFSERETAERLAKSIGMDGTGMLLSPVEGQDRTLWACIAGPFAAYEDAEQTLKRLKAEPRFSQAWIRPLEGLKLEGIIDD